MNEITPLLKKLFSIQTLDEISDDEFELLEFFVVRLFKNLQHKRSQGDKTDSVFQV